MQGHADPGGIIEAVHWTATYAPDHELFVRAIESAVRHWPQAQADYAREIAANLLWTAAKLPEVSA